MALARGICESLLTCSSSSIFSVLRMCHSFLPFYIQFSQNPEMKKILFDTYPKILVEASPRDRLWGIGMGANNPNAENPDKWRGKNLLGYCLVAVRDKLMKEEGLIPKEGDKVMKEKV